MDNVVLSIVVTLPPVLFLIVLFGGGSVFQRKHISQDGNSPINRTVFYASKYLVIILWGTMIVQVWGIHISFIEVPAFLSWFSLLLWFSGFTLLFLGRLELGDSFRLGTPRETTGLKTDGLFKVSRNPMYLGLYATIIASSLYTLNPAVILLGSFVIAVHHTIILGEEAYMQKVFGQQYLDYCHRVRRYI